MDGQVNRQQDHGAALDRRLEAGGEFDQPEPMSREKLEENIRHWIGSWQDHDIAVGKENGGYVTDAFKRKQTERRLTMLLDYIDQHAGTPDALSGIRTVDSWEDRNREREMDADMAMAELEVIEDYEDELDRE